MPWIRIRELPQPDRWESALREAARLSGFRVRFDAGDKRNGRPSVYLYDDCGAEVARFQQAAQALDWLERERAVAPQADAGV